jgi:release factor glutamine methyltransferase
VATLLTVDRALALSGLVPFEAKVLLAHLLATDRAWLAAHGDATLTVEQAKGFDALARRRREGVPIAYLTGRREFYGLDLEITADVLIPRPESEILVEFGLAHIGEAEATRVLDLGSGSGAVALAIAKSRPASTVLGTDVSPAAIALARLNAVRLQIANVEFIGSDWFERVPLEAFDLIVANPPYVADGDPHLAQDDLRYEPAIALKGGVDGLAAIRRIIAGASDYMRLGGWLAIEHGYDQAESVQALLLAVGFEAVNTRRDLAGVLRTTSARRAK